METIENQTTAAASETLGEQLKRLREKKGFSTNELADMLNLTAQTVEAIESDDVGNMPTGPFMRGYLRAWAKHLDVPEAELMAGYEAIGGQQVQTKRVAPSVAGQGRNTLFMVTIVFSFLVIVGLGLWLWKSGLLSDGLSRVLAFVEEAKSNRSQEDNLSLSVSDKSSKQVGQGLTELSIVPEAIPVNPPVTDAAVEPEPVEESTAIEQDILDTGVEAEALPDIPEENTEEVVDVDTNEPIVNMASDEATQASEGVSTSLSITTTTASSWLDVRDKFGTRLYVDLLPAGSTKTFDNIPPYAIFIGHVPSVIVTYQGQQVDLSQHQKSNNTARFSVGK